jgi:hypothetical protein
MSDMTKIFKLLATVIEWSKTRGESCWSAVVFNERCELVKNDYPGEFKYKLKWRGETFDIYGIPGGWIIEDNE